MSAYSSKPRLGQGQVKDYKALAGKVSRREGGRRAQNQQQTLQEAAQEGPRADYKNAAVKILKQEKSLMFAVEITKLALDRRLISKTGRNHDTTMNAVLFADIKLRPDTATFFKTRNGLFGLRAWIGEAWLESSLREAGVTEEDFPLNERQASLCPPPPKRQKWSHKIQVASPARSEGAAGTSTAETDSEDKNSNLNLLLEAADEIDRTENWPEQGTNSRPSNRSLQNQEDASRNPLPTPPRVEDVPDNQVPDNPGWMDTANLQQQDLAEDLATQAQPQPPQTQAFARPPRPSLNRSVRRSIRSTADPNPDPLPSPLQSPNNLVLQIPNGLLQANGAATLQFSPMGYTFLANHLASPMASPLTLAGPTLFSAQPSPASFDPACFPGVSPTIMPLTPLGGPLIDMNHHQLQGLALQTALSTAPGVQHTPPTMFGERTLNLEVRGVALSAAMHQSSEPAGGASVTGAPHIINLDLPDFDVSHDEGLPAQPMEEDAAAVTDAGPVSSGTAGDAAKTAAGPGTPPAPGATKSESATTKSESANNTTAPMEGVVTPASMPAADRPCDQPAGVSILAPTGGHHPELLPASLPTAALDPSTAVVPTSTPAQTHDGGAVIPTRTPTPGLAEETSEPASVEGLEGNHVKPAQPSPSDTARTEPLTIGTGQDLQAVPSARTAAGVNAPAGAGLDEENRPAANDGGVVEDALDASGPGKGEIVHPAQINLTRQHIHLLEKTLGYNHPTVGKAYTFLARLLMNEGSRWSVTMAKRALCRSWNILASLKTQLGTTDPPLAFNDFTYLLKNLENKEGNRPLSANNPNGAQPSMSQAFSPLQSPASQLNPFFMQRIIQQPTGLGQAVAALASPDMRMHGSMSPMALASPVGNLAASAAAYRMLLGQPGSFANFAPLAST